MGAHSVSAHGLTCVPFMMCIFECGLVVIVMHTPVCHCFYSEQVGCTAFDSAVCMLVICFLIVHLDACLRLSPRTCFFLSIHVFQI